MRHPISSYNPFFHAPRFAFGYEHLQDDTRILDFGCHDAAFGRELLNYRRVQYYGVDKNREAIARAPEGLVVKELEFPLPFPDGDFDAVMIFEVLEHIADQDRVLRELFRVMKPGGMLLVSAPRRHIFTFLDLANFKFMFPALHRIYYTLTRSKKAWQERYESNPNGLVGDIEKEKLWHQHFRDTEMRDLLERNGFCIKEMDGAGLFSQVMTFVGYIFHLQFLFPQGLRDWDNKTFHYATLLCAAYKPAGSVDNASMGGPRF
ncbi:MAG: methyltransferase domain-containing protein [Candidatus Contendobacter sp.]|nr:methyltransferase domain-containing protein [Candidatus Contendobacter sp.]MDG4558528.1 methyltransferase domain-containing protein [Candidatus Contendobacter sp.]